MSLRRFVKFIKDLFSVGSDANKRQLMSNKQTRTPAMIRGALMRAARKPDFKSQVRVLQFTEEPLVTVELNDFISLRYDKMPDFLSCTTVCPRIFGCTYISNPSISLSFDFNFGDGQKDLLFGVQFQYDSGDSLSDS
jgi:hypothetical protein